MKMLFKKRRYYQGAFRAPGTVMEVDAYYARAFQRVGAAIPAILVEKKTLEEQNPFSKPVRTLPPAKQAVEDELKESEEGGIDVLPDSE
jgi:hypothetical protein